MPKINLITAYSDENENSIVGEVAPEKRVEVNFRGRGNKLIIEDGANIAFLKLDFPGSNALVRIGRSFEGSSLKFTMRVGQDCQVRIGDNCSTTSKCIITAAEGTSVEIGDDVMIASEVQLRNNDSHPIFDVFTGERLNLSRDIVIGNHVWIGDRAVVMGGSTIGAGSVIGLGSLVKGAVPNNCIAVGSPAKTIRRNIAWERPHLSLKRPFYKPNAESIEKSQIYWNETDEV